MAGEFVMSRVFDAPRDLVWKCFTEPERMKQWWGPKGFKVLSVKMDLRAGADRTGHVGQVCLSRSRPAGTHGFHQFLL